MQSNSWRTAMDIGVGHAGIRRPPEVDVVDPVHDTFRAVIELCPSPHNVSQ